MKHLLQTLITFWPSILLLGLAAPVYSYCALHDEGKLRGWGRATGFFGVNQYQRKWKMYSTAPNTWYYRFFKLKYHEAYPLSATILAFTTDGYHSFQLVWKALIIASAAILTPSPWAFFLIGFSLFTFVFMFGYKLLSR